MNKITLHVAELLSGQQDVVIEFEGDSDHPRSRKGFSSALDSMQVVSEDTETDEEVAHILCVQHSGVWTLGIGKASPGVPMPPFSAVTSQHSDSSCKLSFVLLDSLRITHRRRDLDRLPVR